MRRSMLCCALFVFAVAGCSSSAGTYAPAGSYAPPPPAVRPTAAAATQAPQDHWRPTAAASMGGLYTPPPPVYQTAPPQLVPPVVFPSLGTNPYVDTTRDHVSTFALDVDTASYTVARGYVSSGNRPNPASVRPEEWVNYFDQGYTPPEGGAFAIQTDGGPTPFLTSSEQLLRVGVRARDNHYGRRPMALTFVIDCSGSMADDGRLELVKQSLALLVSQLRGEDRLAIVGFSTDAWVVLDSTSGENKDRILTAIAKLRPQDTTNAEGGLRLGYKLERSQRIEGGTNRVVLATDGVANVGTTNAQTILDEVGADASSGIQLVAIGVGMGNYNDAFLEKLADAGEGFYDYIDTIDEAQRIFVDELTTTLDTVALDAKAQIDFNPEAVAGYRLIGYEDRGVPDEQFRDPNAKGGAIGAGHQVTALYAIVLRPAESRNQRLATVSLRWTDPSTQSAKEIAEDVLRGDLASSFGATDAHFKLDALVAATAETLRGSPWIPGYSVNELRGAAQELARQLPQTDEVRDFLTLVDQLARLTP